MSAFDSLKKKITSQSSQPPQDAQDQNSLKAQINTDFKNAFSKPVKTKKSEAILPENLAAQSPASENSVGVSDPSHSSPTAKTETPTTSSTAPQDKEISAEEFVHKSQPDKYTKQEMEDLRLALKITAESIEEKEMVGDAIRSVMIMLKENPNLKELIMPEDIGTMVRALRENYGILIEKKNTRATKTTKARKDVEDVAKEMEEMNINFNM